MKVADIPMKVAAIVINIFLPLPGVGTLLVQKWVQAIFQIVLAIVAWFLILTVFGGIIGVPLLFAVWIWAIVSAATAPAEPITVVVQHQDKET